MDIALGRHKWTLADENALVNKMTSFGTTNTFINTVYSFLDNRTFYNLFMNRHQDLFNTKLHKDTIGFAFDEFVDYISPEMQLHYARWPEHSYENWATVEIDKINEFIDQRPFYASKHMDEFFDLGGIYRLAYETSQADAGEVSLNTLDRIVSGFSGTYFKSIPVSLTAKANPGYYFHFWEINGIKHYQSKIIRTFSKDIKAVAFYSTEPPDDFVVSILDINGNLEVTVNNQLDDNIIINIYSTAGHKVKQYIERLPLKGTLLIPIAFKPSTNGIFFIHLSQSKNTYVHKIAYLK